MIKKPEFMDTHCHVQFSDYQLDSEEVIKNAEKVGVNRLMLVGCSLPDSQAAIEMASRHGNCWASIGLHPHEASRYVHDHHALQQFRELAGHKEVVAIGEIGLDYYYQNSPKDAQAKILRYQLDIAKEHNLPIIFHVREAFDDFWRILDDYKGVRGVVHSFSSDTRTLEQIISKGLYVGLNGIMTFTKNQDQLDAAKAVPLDRLLLETDAPFLTPVPFRGKIGEPKFVKTTAEFLANLRGESLDEIASSTTANARKLFSL